MNSPIPDVRIWGSPCGIMTSTTLHATELVAARRRVIEAKLKELVTIKRKLRASRRRYTVRGFNAWQVLAAARRRRNVSERRESLARSPP